MSTILLAILLMVLICRLIFRLISSTPIKIILLLLTFALVPSGLPLVLMLGLGRLIIAATLVIGSLLIILRRL